MLSKFKLLVDKCLRKIYFLTITSKVNKLRNKTEISVLFILNDLSKWKTEQLYIEMESHPRFKPIIGVTLRRGESPSAMSRKVLELIDYLNNNNYPYIELTKTINPNPDIVIYTEPYGGAVPSHQSVYNYWNSLFININYSSHTTHLHIDYFTRVHECAWIDCYESKNALEDAYKYIGKKRKSLKLTGLPMIDALKTESVKNPWKEQSKIKKKIIWAPHHSLGGFDNETIVYSNFIEMHQYMLDIAKRYADEIQIAFKPHPLLREKLEIIWGPKKTNDYYEKWNTLSNGQLETGEYLDLFKCSDAMIHDSSSFIVEYQLMDKPSLFIVRNEENILKDMNSFGRSAFYSQLLGYTLSDIDKFIKDTILNNDVNKQKRNNFIENEITGIKGLSASKRIIKEILDDKT